MTLLKCVPWAPMGLLNGKTQNEATCMEQRLVGYACMCDIIDKVLANNNARGNTPRDSPPST